MNIKGNGMTLTREELVKLSHKVNYAVMSSLIDRATKKMRAVTANLDKTSLMITMIFDSVLIESEQLGMQNAYNKVVEEIGAEFAEMTLQLNVVESSVSLLGNYGNMGWFFLRREYEEEP